MKFTGRQSTNIEDRTRDTSVQAPHRNPFDKAAPYNQIINKSRDSEVKTQIKMDASRAKEFPKNNPFSQMVSGMEASAKRDRNANIKARQAGINAKIPIPTPRPDNSKPLPKVFRYDNNKG